MSAPTQRPTRLELLLGQAQKLVDELRAELEAQRRASAALVTMSQYAKSHGISISTVRTAIREGRLAATKIGRAVRLAPDAKISPRTRRETKIDRHLRLLSGGLS